VRFAPSEVNGMTLDEIVRLTGRAIDYRKQKRG
jgi:hypothetical protein